MARLINNPLGVISGKAGALVFKKTKYGNYISSLPTYTKKTPSVPQQLQQSKMKVVMRFLGPLKRILRNTYFPLHQDSPTFNLIKSYYLRKVVNFGEQGHTINYAKSLVSYGDILPPAQPTSLWQGQREVQLTWEPQCDQAMASQDDPLFAVIYYLSSHQFFFVPRVATREEGAGSFLLPKVWNANTPYHLWVGFSRPDEKRASTSIYLGEL